MSFKCFAQEFELTALGEAILCREEQLIQAVSGDWQQDYVALDELRC